MVLNQLHSKLDPKAKEHLFVWIAEHAKAWKYFNKVSKHIQISRNINFDLNDTRIFPIPNKDKDNDDLIILLKGEIQSHERAMDPIQWSTQLPHKCQPCYGAVTGTWPGPTIDYSMTQTIGLSLCKT